MVVYPSTVTELDHRSRGAVYIIEDQTLMNNTKITVQTIEITLGRGDHGLVWSTLSSTPAIGTLPILLKSESSMTIPPLTS